MKSIQRPASALWSLLLVFAMVWAVAAALPAQDLSEVDFSDAHLSLAGPRSFYVRGLSADGKRFSVLVSPADDGTWTVQRVVDAEENILPPGTVLDLASVRRVDDRTLEVDGVVIDDNIYSGKLHIGPDLTIRPVDGVSEGEADALSDARGRGLAAAGLGMIPEVQRLERETERLAEENSRLSQTVTELRAENEYLRGEVSRLVSRVEELEAQNAAIAEEEAAEEEAAEEDTEVGTAALLSEAERITSKLDALGTQLTEVEERLSNQIAATTIPESTDGEKDETAADPAGRMEELRRRIAELELANAELQAEKAALQERILDRVAGGGFVAMMAPRMRREVIDGFSEARVQLGEWRISGNTATQTDPEQYFAKLMLPAPQRTRPTLYRFTSRSLDEGWVGLGLHIFVEETGKKGYGLGRSLLVWFTRDPDVYRSRRTYLQIYRSDDDVNMARVADAVISEPIAEALDIEVLFEPENNYITVAVNGRDKLRYRTWFGIDEGTTVALRSLGRAQFSRLTVRTTE